MGERRKRKSAWEEDDTKHTSGMNKNNSWTKKDRSSSHSSGNYHEVSESTTRKSRDYSGWPAWESIEEHPNAPTDSSFKNSQDGKEFGGGKRYYKNMSPGFDGIELCNYNDTDEYDQSRPQRYPGRGNSRSRSRSLSRGRDSGRERRRSRSRSRTDVKVKDYTRTRSPINARQSYEWSDRKRGIPEKSSQICRDFLAGSCRRGSQCSFYHPNTSSRRDRDIMEDDPSESWRSRTDYNRGSRHFYSSRASSGFESRPDVSDPYHDDRRALPCKDFLKGNCRWGDTCRFSHRDLSDDGYDHGTGNVSFDKGKNGKPLCKFFASGKCSRENCWFSHEDPSSNRRDVVTTERRSHNKSNRWDGSTWDDAATKIDDRGDGSWEKENKNWGNIESTLPGESGSYGRNTDFFEPIAKENERNNDRRDVVTTERSSHDKSYRWNGPTWDDATTKVDDRGDKSWKNENKTQGKVGSSLPGESGSYGKNTGFYEPIAKENENKNGGNIERTFSGESGSSGRNTGFYEPIAKKNENKNWGNTQSTSPGENGSSGRNTGFYEPIVNENENRNLEKIESTFPGESGSSGGNTGFCEPIAKENENKNWGKIESTFPGESGSCGRNSGFYEPVAKENENKNCEKIVSTFPGESGSSGRNTGFYEPIVKENEEDNWGKTESTFPEESKSSGKNTGLYVPIAKENEKKKWGKTEIDFPGESGSCGIATGFYEPIGKENTYNIQENLVYGSEFQDHDRIGNIDGKNALQQKIYPASQIQQQHYELIGNSEMNSIGRDEVKETTSHLIPLSGHRNAASVFPGHSSISSESDRGQNLLLPNNPSNGFCADLNEPNTSMVDPLNVQTHTQNNPKASQSPGLVEAKVPELLASLLTKKLSDQVTNFRSFVNEHSQTYAETPSIPDTSGWAQRANTSNAQIRSGAVSIDLNSIGNDRENTEHENLNLSQRTDHDSRIQLKQSSPLPVVGMVFDRSKVRQEDVTANSEVTEGNKAVGDENKGIEENKHFENHDGHERGEEGGANKNEKGMRLFKNTLVEFVKEILKPTWKEGRMSRDDHKTVVRKVVDKVSSTIQVEHIPKTQENVDQYLACSKPKITKLVQAYVERFVKKDS